MFLYLLIPTLCFAQRFLQADETCYGVILDCGSSSTKTTIYSWPCRTSKIYPLTDITQESQQLKTSPGVSTKYPDEISTYLAPIFEFINSKVPVTQKEYTPIFMGATAGMRLLDINKQNALIDEIRKQLSRSGYLFQADNWARVISGQDEATYLWLGVEYLLGKTDGSLITIDLGGASTQIAFKVDYIQYESDIVTLTLPDEDINLYAISYLGYGNDQARDAVLAKSISGTQVISPCYHQGYSGTWTYQKVQYSLSGSGNVEQCQALIQSFLNSQCRTVKDELCGINAIDQPQLPTSYSIYAVSGVATIANFLQLNTFKLPQFLSQAQEFCKMSWSQVQANSTYSSNQYVSTNFFLSLYVHQLLSIGYNIPDTMDINAPLLINSQTPTWAMAAVQYQLAQVDCDLDSSICQGSILNLMAFLCLMILYS
ncbi:unnamed protein product [Paramecium pentaurelia]|uniref:Uncharacterized protein n=1 Tax=Paramecium pentaurelia TaxID=43138 RepID=A0A8S1U319_9CILI|nr:unnamed protein product [Paramecium pentaurelia]